ncbi:ABC transporter ATP-binding protein [Mycolicibacterium goodii]|uniref:ABC transporter ATP-binding protein n=1 Tax=Mycolicibacterium goodii TaxID=134601 RepID=UPI000C2635AF|nr:ABC transporter ATP-binding protein [Mycolicibacterium goodii]PJK18211.1 glutathione ABC transporter ATP-binding protein [Mycolicibacterium goodii]
MTAEQSDPVLSVADLTVDFATKNGRTPAVRSISFDVRPGEVVALVGESGSGKSVTSMSVLGLLPGNAQIGGHIVFGGQDLLTASPRQLEKVRGAGVAMIFQEPMTALNPVLSIGHQIVEAIRCHKPEISTSAARTRAVELMTSVGIPDPAVRADHYPHQLSGGQRQRAMIAMALSCEPKLLIADEPTTALDVTVQAEILELLRHLRDRLSTAILLITHDMGVVADLADRVLVMRSGEIVERADVNTLFGRPDHDYTKQLLASVPRLTATPRGGQHPAAPIEEPTVADCYALRVKNLVMEYGTKGRGRSFRALDSVSFDIPRGHVLGLVGESGSGKSTLGRIATGLLRPTSGSVEIVGTDIARLPERKLRPLRTKFAMVFQDPASSLNPRLNVLECVSEPIRLQKQRSGVDARRRAYELLDMVGLPSQCAERRPHELSGGQRQRVGIARGIALDPELLIADEPTSALDVSVQAKVLELFAELQRTLGFSCLFITHDLAVVEQLADGIAVLRHGRLVESGDTRSVLNHPRDEYTRNLILSAPIPDPAEQRSRRLALAGS